MRGTTFVTSALLQPGGNTARRSSAASSLYSDATPCASLEPSRWRPKVTLEWSPVPPKLVVEVRYDKWQGQRIRHGTKFLRFRPDKDPKDCTIDQVRPRPRKGDPTVPELLARAS